MGIVSLHHKLDHHRLSSDCHIHTNYVDGKHSVAECVKRAEESGLELIVISEHVRRNLTYDFSKLLQDIYEARKRARLHILVGAEAKVIDMEGNLDISPQVREKVDVLLGCFHSWFKETPPTKDEYLAALLNMIRKHNADVWAHSFLFLNSYGLCLEIGEVREIAQTLKENRVFLEINLRHQCPQEAYLTLLLDENVPWIIGSDAHAKEDIWDRTKPAFISPEAWQKLRIIREQAIT